MTNAPDPRVLREAMEWFFAEVLPDCKPHKCQVCLQNAQLQHRPLSSGLAAILVYQHAKVGLDWAHTVDLLAESTNPKVRKLREVAKLAHWGLVEEEPTLRPDGGRAGWWRVTPLGVQWIEGDVLMASHAFIYNADLIGMDNRKKITLREALKKRFDLEELKRGI